MLGDGGFGIVYLAKDTALGRNVAIKEFLPISHAVRVQENKVQPRGPEHETMFEKGMQSFISEARILAQFRNPYLVEVLRFWQSHGTAYIVMPYYQGKTLRELIQKGYRVTSRAELFNIIMPLLDGLAQVHEVGCYHRDISPDNIIMLSSGSPLLLDFGAARHEMINQTEYSTVILKPGFAPIEQYGGKETAGQQGAWTDIYALCAVAYQLITGIAPPASVARIMRDPMVSLNSQSDRLPLPKNVLSAIDVGLQIQPEDRPQSIEAFRSLFDEPPSLILAATEGDRIHQQELSANIAVTESTQKPAIPDLGMEETTHSANTSMPERSSKPKTTGNLWQAIVITMALMGIVGYALFTSFSGTKPLSKTEKHDKSTNNSNIAPAVEKKEPAEKQAPQHGELPRVENHGTPQTEAAVVQDAPILLPGSKPELGDSKETVTVVPNTPVLSNEHSDSQADTSTQTGARPKSESIPTFSRSPAEQTVVKKSGKEADKPDLTREGKAPPTTGKIIVEAKPWGDVYVNGEMVGTAPPRMTLEIPAGNVMVEIRNDSATAYSRTVDVRAGRTARVSHDFTQKDNTE